MRAINVGVSHQNDLVVAKFGNIELVSPNSSTKRHDEIADLLAGKHPVKSGALNVEDFTLERQNRLRATVTPGLSRAAGAIALDDEKLGLGRVFLRAILELSGKVIHIHRGFAPCQLARLARGLPCEGGLDYFPDNLLGFIGIFL